MTFINFWVILGFILRLIVESSHEMEMKYWCAKWCLLLCTRCANKFANIFIARVSMCPTNVIIGNPTWSCIKVADIFLEPRQPTRMKMLKNASEDARSTSIKYFVLFLWLPLTSFVVSQHIMFPQKTFYYQLKLLLSLTQIIVCLQLFKSFCGWLYLFLHSSF